MTDGRTDRQRPTAKTAFMHSDAAVKTAVFSVSCAQLTRNVLQQTYGTDRKRTFRRCAFWGLNPPDIKNPKPTKKIEFQKFIHPSYPTYKNSQNWSVRLFFFQLRAEMGDCQKTDFVHAAGGGQRLEWRPGLSLANLTVPFTPADLWADKSALTVAALSMWISSRRPTFLCRPTNGTTDRPSKVFDPFWLRRMEYGRMESMSKTCSTTKDQNWW